MRNAFVCKPYLSKRCHWLPLTRWYSPLRWRKCSRTDPASHLQTQTLINTHTHTHISASQSSSALTPGRSSETQVGRDLRGHGEQVVMEGLCHESLLLLGQTHHLPLRSLRLQLLSELLQRRRSRQTHRLLLPEHQSHGGRAAIVCRTERTTDLYVTWTTKPVITVSFMKGFHWCMVCYDRTIFVWDTTILNLESEGAKKSKYWENHL